MIPALIRALIGIALIVLCVVLVVWFMAEMGLGLPPMVVKIFYVIAVLVAILWIYRVLSPHWGNWVP